MAKRRNSKSGGDQSGIVVLIVFAFLITSITIIIFSTFAIIDYFYLKKKYALDGNVMRIIDIDRAISRALKAYIPMMIPIGLILAIYLFNVDERSFSFAHISAFVLSGAMVLFIGFLYTRTLSAGLIGVVVDKERDLLIFPTDGVLRSFNPLLFHNTIIPSGIEIIKLSEIKQKTRQAGKTLLIAGPFGSRAITFSDKLRRDELLGYLSGYKSFSDFEHAGAGDYL